MQEINSYLIPNVDSNGKFKTGSPNSSLQGCGKQEIQWVGRAAYNPQPRAHGQGAGKLTS